MLRSNRRFDVIIFGATGVTGRYVIEQMFKSGKQEGLTWAVAGRSESRLEKVLKEVAPWINENPEDFAQTTPKIIADVAEPSSLREMARSCRLVINTVGPYRFYGEKVVSACVEESTDHLDVSGEPQYMESMQLKYHEQAKEKGIYVISACGFDSVPCETLVNFTKKSFPGRVNWIETFLSMKSPKGGHTNTGTWNSVINGVADQNELAPLRKKIRETLFQKPMETPDFRLGELGLPPTTPILSGYCLPFLGSDRAVVIKSEMFRNEVQDDYHPVQIKTYFRVPNLPSIFVFAIVGTVFSLLCKFSFGRSLLSSYPSLFSFGYFKEGAPSREQLEARTMTLTSRAVGWKDGEDVTKKPTQEMVCSFRGPDPAYIGTSIMLVQSAMCVFKDRDLIPMNGGVLSPGFAFENSSLQQRLEERGFKYTVVSQK